VMPGRLDEELLELELLVLVVQWANGWEIR
jgi:hypothetical protein